MSIDDKFKAVSECSRARSKLKNSSYRGGPLGYQYYRDEIAKEFLKKGIHINHVPRHKTWLRAHSHFKDEKYTFKNPRCNSERGEIVFENRRDDILARALKKAERGGHVRGVGSGITKKQCFGFAKPTPRSQLHNELNCVRSEVAMLKNQNNVIMSYLLSGQNIEEFKQLMASGVSSQSSVPTGQGNGSGQPNSTYAQQENVTQVTSSSEFGPDTGFFTELLHGGVNQGGQSAIFSQGNPYSRPQEFQETEYTRPHNEEQEHELELYQVSWPDTTNANSPQHGNCSVPWLDTYDTQPISNLPEGMHDCCLASEDNKEIHIVAIGQVYISGSTLVVKNHFFDLAPGTHRVSVIDDLVPTALLPCPTELFTFVCQSKDSFVPWPTHLIFSKKKCTKFSKVNNQLKDKENTPISRLPSKQASSKKTYNITNKDRAMVTSGLLEAFKKEAIGLRQRNGAIILNIPFNVLHNEMVIRLDYEDIFDWCFQREVGSSHMSIFMRYLSEECQMESISGLYGFCDVNFVSPLTPTEGVRTDYLCNVLGCNGGKNINQIFFAPLQDQ
ncbi:uncharacterized protein LOC110724252 isoform X2 [Chenopodium quinoa]|uniref:uncharacterized protein LOC110724252 isoform X2 n=1 Tax=Chenopodium quinoa TaxID=63459 RepID=UPI000B7968FF|nr:uncharacterized protein LOC110724252 isoform X2 [Chenopodium quinoa]